MTIAHSSRQPLPRTLPLAPERGPFTTALLLVLAIAPVASGEATEEAPPKVRLEVRKKAELTLEPLPTAAPAPTETPTAPAVTPPAPVAPAPPPVEPPKVAARRRVFVRHLSDSAGLGEAELQSFTTIAGTALARHPGFEVLSEADLKGVLATDALRQALGCDDEKCTRSLAGTLDAELMMSGAVSRTSMELTLSLALLDLATARPVAKVQRPLPSGLNTHAAIERTVEELVMRSLGRAVAELTLSSDPLGATVTLDGQVLGETPLPAIPVRAGVHEVIIQREGYESQRITVLLADGDVRAELLRLQPVAAQMAVEDVAALAAEVAQKSAELGATEAAQRVGADVDRKLDERQAVIDEELRRQQEATARRLSEERADLQARIDAQEQRDNDRSVAYDQKAAEAKLAADRATQEAEAARQEAEEAQATAAQNSAELRRKADETKREMEARAKRAQDEATRAAQEAEAARVQAERTRVQAEQARREAQAQLERARQEQAEASKSLEAENRRAAERLRRETASDVARAREEMRDAVGYEDPRRTGGVGLRFQVAPQLDPALAPAQASHRNGRELPSMIGLDVRIPLVWQFAAVVDLDLWPSRLDFTAVPSGLQSSASTRAPVGFTEVHVGVAARGLLVGPLYVDLGAAIGPRWTRVAIQGPTGNGQGFGYQEVFGVSAGFFGGLGFHAGPWYLGFVARGTVPLGGESDANVLPGATGPVGFGQVVSFGAQTGLMF